MDISKQLHAYEVEYHVLQDELSDAPPPSEESDRLDKLEKSNVQLKKQNMDLLEKLQVCDVSSLFRLFFITWEKQVKHVIKNVLCQFCQ